VIPTDSVVPDALYKYFPLQGTEDLNRVKTVLTNHKIYAGSPQKFNDPFDCKARFSWETCQREFREWAARMAKSGDPPEPAQGDWLALYEDSDRRTAYEAAVQEEIYKRGVICLTEDPLHPLMWGHYASGSSGLCIGFAGLEQFSPLRVRYSEEPPAPISVAGFPTSQDGTAALVDALIGTKSADWAYEREWRILVETPGLQPFDEGLVSKVYLGPRIVSAHAQAIRSWIDVNDKRRVAVHEVELDHDDFSLRTDD